MEGCGRGWPARRDIPMAAITVAGEAGVTGECSATQWDECVKASFAYSIGSVDILDTVVDSCWAAGTVRVKAVSADCRAQTVAGRVGGPFWHIWADFIASPRGRIPSPMPASPGMPRAAADGPRVLAGTGTSDHLARSRVGASSSLAYS